MGCERSVPVEFDAALAAKNKEWSLAQEDSAKRRSEGVIGCGAWNVSPPNANGWYYSSPPTLGGDGTPFHHPTQLYTEQKQWLYKYNKCGKEQRLWGIGEQRVSGCLSDDWEPAMWDRQESTRTEIDTYCTGCKEAQAKKKEADAIANKQKAQADAEQERLWLISFQEQMKAFAAGPEPSDLYTKQMYTLTKLVIAHEYPAIRVVERRNFLTHLANRLGMSDAAHGLTVDAGAAFHQSVVHQQISGQNWDQTLGDRTHRLVKWLPTQGYSQYDYTLSEAIVSEYMCSNAGWLLTTTVKDSRGSERSVMECQEHSGPVGIREQIRTWFFRIPPGSNGASPI
jgi:hypothetical protein